MISKVTTLPLDQPLSPVVRGGDVLGPHAEDDVAVRRRLRGGKRPTLEREAEVVAARRRPSVLGDEVGGQEVHLQLAHEAGDEDVRRVVEHVDRPPVLLDDAVAHDRDPRSHRHRLVLVVGDVDERPGEALLQRDQLAPRLHPQPRVEIAQRLVHQEHLRLAHDRPADGDALLLPARELAWQPVEQVADLEQRHHLLRARPDHLARHLATAQRELQVLPHGHVRVERVVLEDHRDVAVLRRHVGDVPPGDRDLAGRGRLEAGDQPQQRRLAAARGPEQDHELALAAGERDVVDRDDLAERLRHPLDDDPVGPRSTLHRPRDETAR